MGLTKATRGRERAFVCSICGKKHHAAEGEYVCPHCGEIGILEPDWLPSARSKLFSTAPGMWRYERLLLLSPEAPRPPIQVGATPLMPAGRLSTALGLDNLFIKNDTLNPTGSLKDRASAVVLARAAEVGAKRVAVASTGNAGSSLAGLAASTGIPAVIFVPEKAPRAKLVQSLMYGAQVFAVRGTYDDAFDLCLRACETFGWYNRNTAMNPYTIEGKKTVSYEIYEQLGHRAPEIVLVPTGDGCILSGVARGFRGLRNLGLISSLPRLIAVQASGSDAIARALKGDGEIRPIEAHTVADSIKVGMPRNGRMAVRDIKESGGRAVLVDDDEIMAAMAELASLTGVFAEPAAAASLAGLRELLREEIVRADATIVLLVTGSGLKDIVAAKHAASEPVTITPSLHALKMALKRHVLATTP